jgi:hypothetical protein
VKQLHLGIQRGFYSSEFLEKLLSEMRASNTYKKIKERTDYMFKLDHTPFARDDGLKDYGFHMFIGREVFEEGHEYIVTVSYGSSISGGSIDSATGDLIQGVSQQRKVLLTKSPGKWTYSGKGPPLASRTYLPFNEKDLEKIKRGFEANLLSKGLENPFNYQPQ